MSSFAKNIIPRRTHKERAQPSARIQKHGLLEKKSDYKLRAKHRNRKRLRIKLLREKAAFRNPDEFYHGMISSTTDGGRVRRTLNDKEKDAIPLSHRTRDQRMLAETQDARYVGAKYTAEAGRLQQFKKRLHFLDAAERAPRKHVFYVDDEEDMRRVVKEKAQKKTSAEYDHYQHSSSRPKTVKMLQKEESKSYNELHQRIDRHNKLKTVLQDLATEKALLSKGRRFLERPSNAETGAPAIFKWRQERRR